MKEFRTVNPYDAYVKKLQENKLTFIHLQFTQQFAVFWDVTVV
jgi:hypothetical protein